MYVYIKALEGLLSCLSSTVAVPLRYMVYTVDLIIVTCCSNTVIRPLEASFQPWAYALYCG
jgi:hypothetical protein